MPLNRREFVAVSGGALAVPVLGAPAAKSKVALVTSSHKKLAQPASPEDPLDYEKVRAMVWQAIDYGRTRAGRLEDKIKPGSWVVIKPNIVFLRPQPGYAPGDVTDARVTKAVLEYVARKSRAGRITIAEGGSYRNLKDPAQDNAVLQDGQRVDAMGFNWGDKEWPGFGGSFGAMLAEFAKEFPNKKFDYVDLSYDGVRDASGKLQRIEVPRTRRGVGAASERPDYFVTNTIRNCDFLLAVPVMKVHEQCGITACFKSYVGTAPREAYAVGSQFWNVNLHGQHSVDNRIDPFIVDLSAFHPPDYNVVDGIRGLQYTEHNNRRPDQTVRSNLVLAGEDTVATDAVVSMLLGFNPSDMEFLHLAAARDMGTMDFNRIDVIGDDPGPLRRRWIKPRQWYGRCNREWLVTKDPASPMGSWTKYVSPTDTLMLAKAAGQGTPETAYAAAVRVNSSGASKANLWFGARGKFTVTLNGDKVLEDENRTRYRVGQFQKPVELRSGENLLVIQAQGLADLPQVSVLLVGPRNDGDSLEGIRWFV